MLSSIEIDLELKFKIWNVFLMADLRLILPILIQTGPTSIFVNSKGVSYLLIILSSCAFFVCDGYGSIYIFGSKLFESILTSRPFLSLSNFVFFCSVI